MAADSQVEASLPGRPARLSELSDIGVRLLALIARQGRWIQRRSEEISFDDALTVRRETTLDISLQRFFAPQQGALPLRLPTQGSRLLVPISTFDRANHFDIEVRTATGESLPHLSRLQERRLLAAGMSKLSLSESGSTAAGVEQLAELWNRYNVLLEILQADPVIRSTEEFEIDEIPNMNGTDGPPWLESVSDLLFKYGSRYLVIATPPLDSIFGEGPNGTDSSELFRIIECHSEAIPSTRKNSFNAPLLKDYSHARRKGDMVDQWWTKAGRSLKSADNEPLWEEKILLDDTTVEIVTSQLEAQSCHFYVHLPNGTYVDRAILGVASEPFDSGNRISLIQIADDDVHWNVAHFGWSRRLLPKSDDVILDSRVLMIIRPVYSGFLRAPTLLSLLTTMTLIVLTGTLGWTSAEFPGWRDFPLARSGQSDPVTVILLGVLTVGLGVIIRDQEHRMTSKAADRFRLRLGLISISTFFTALVVGIGIDGTCLFWLLASFSSFALVMFAGVQRMARYSRKRRNEKPLPDGPTPRGSWWRSAKSFMGVELRYVNVPDWRRLPF